MIMCVLLGKGLGKTLKCLSSHYNKMACGKLLKALEIIWQVPEQVIVFAQRIVLANCGYHGYSLH